MTPYNLKPKLHKVAQGLIQLINIIAIFVVVKEKHDEPIRQTVL